MRKLTKASKPCSDRAAITSRNTSAGRRRVRSACRTGVTAVTPTAAASTRPTTPNRSNNSTGALCKSLKRRNTSGAQQAIKWRVPAGPQPNQGLSSQWTMPNRHMATRTPMEYSLPSARCMGMAATFPCNNCR